MPRITRFSLKLVMSVSVALLFCGCQDNMASQGDTTQPPSGININTFTPSPHEQIVPLGGALPLTGPVAHLGKDAELGIRLAIDELNQKPPTIDGKITRFTLVVLDDKSDPQLAQRIAQQLVDKKVHGVIGHLNSGTSIPAAKIYATAGIPQITPATTHPAYTQQNLNTVYRIVTNDTQQGQALGAFAVQNLAAKNIAVIDDRSVYGQGVADEFVKFVEAHRAKIVKREFTSTTASDFTAILTSIRAARPDLIFFGGMDIQGAALARQIKKLDIPAKLLGADGMLSPEFINAAEDSAEGQYASFIGYPREKMPGFQKFNLEFSTQYGSVQLYAPYAYDAVYLLVDAMKRANSIHPKHYAPLLKTTDYHGITQHISFDHKGDLVHGVITIYQVRNGQWEALHTVSQ